MIQISFQASNGAQSAAIDLYAYPEEILEFSKELIDFPFTPDNQVSFEYGTDPSYYCFFKLSAKLLNLSGHPAFELKYDNRRAIPEKAEGLFYMQCEASLINSFGKQLSKFDFLTNWGEMFDRGGKSFILKPPSEHIKILNYDYKQEIVRTYRCTEFSFYRASREFSNWYSEQVRRLKA